jgi:hypothetical protein
MSEKDIRFISFTEITPRLLLDSFDNPISLIPRPEKGKAIKMLGMYYEIVDAEEKKDDAD